MSATIILGAQWGDEGKVREMFFALLQKHGDWRSFEKVAHNHCRARLWMYFATAFSFAAEPKGWWFWLQE
jgi:hypothetical protein